MTKKLEDLFNLNEANPKELVEAVEIQQVVDHQEVTSLEDSYRAVNNIVQTLPQIQELDDLGEKELDDLAAKAEEAYDDLMDLGMNVEVRYASRIFEVASSMLNNAINAKTAKIDKKLKAVDLQLKKLKMDKDSPEDPNNILQGQGHVILDRNELLKKLGQKD